MRNRAITSKNMNPLNRSTNSALNFYFGNFETVINRAAPMC